MRPEETVDMGYLRERLLYVVLFMTWRSSTTAASKDSHLNGTTEECGNEICGYQAKCAYDTCTCEIQRGVILRSRKPPGVQYCAEICDSVKCPDSTVCSPAPDGPDRCFCAKGYRRSPWGQCSDIDECEKPDRCGNNSVCRNSDGNYTCECQEGYRSSTNDTLGCIEWTGVVQSKHNYTEREPERESEKNDTSFNFKPEQQGSAQSTANFNMSHDDESMTLTIGLTAGLGSLFAFAVVVIIVVMWKRHRTPHKDAEAIQMNTLDVNYRDTSHLYNSVVNPQFSAGFQENRGESMKVIAQVSQPENTPANFPSQAAVPASYEEVDVAEGLIISEPVGVVSPSPRLGTGPSAARISSGYEVAVPIQNSSLNNQSTPIYSAISKGTKTGMMSGDKTETYSNRKIKDNKAKQKAEREDDLDKEQTNNDYSTLYKTCESFGKSTEKKPEIMQHPSADGKSRNPSNEGECYINLPTEKGNDSTRAAVTDDEEYDKLRTVRV